MEKCEKLEMYPDSNIINCDVFKKIYYKCDKTHLEIILQYRAALSFVLKYTRADTCKN